MANLVRYADDFVITGRSRELLEGEVRRFVERFLAERGLELSPEKTTITHIDRGFDFLGLTVRKYWGKLLITPSKESAAETSAEAALRKEVEGLNYQSESFGSLGLSSFQGLNQISPVE